MKGKAFRPVEGNTGTQATNVFVLDDQGTHYVAVFNYTQNAHSTPWISFVPVSLRRAASYTVTDVWSGQSQTASGSSLDVTLKAAESKLYKIVLNP